MAFFTMRLAAPIASLAAPRIDTTGGTLPVPSLSMLTGIIGAALGLRPSDRATLQQLQDTMRVAFVVDRPGTIVRDYQIVRMGHPHMKGPMWWHDGRRLGTMARAGGEPERTVPTERPLTCDFAATAIVELLDGAPFDSATILKALREPVFPVGLGQQCCLFSEPVAGRIVKGVESLEQAVATVTPGTIYLPADVSTGNLGDIYATISAGRDWKSRQHGGSTVYRVRASIREAHHGDAAVHSD
jgi:CRISPR system Cascade subunit CasD